MKHLKQNRLVFAAIITTASIAHADTQTANWLGGTGSWFDATKWSGGVVPNDTATTDFDANIDGGNSAASAVTLTGANAAVRNLTIDAGDSLSVQYASAPRLDVLGQLTVNGSLDSGSMTVPANATLAGSGTIYGRVGQFGLTSNGAFTLGPGLTFTAHASETPSYGYAIGWSSAPPALPQFINQGRILADGTGGPQWGGSYVYISAHSFINHGQIELADRGYVIIDGDLTPGTIGTVVGTGGTLAVGQAGRLDLQGNSYGLGLATIAVIGTISNGTLIPSTSGRPISVPYGANSVFENVTLGGATISLEGQAKIVGELGGHGTISIDAAAIESYGYLEIPVIRSGITVRKTAPANLGEVRFTRNEGRIAVDPFRRNDFLETVLPISPLDTSSGRFENAGSLEVHAGGSLAASQFGPGRLSFVNGGELVISGGGTLTVGGTLDLLSSQDALVVLPKADGTPYVNQPIAFANILGVFDQVTPGITVTYGVDTITISGTPTPEPTIAFAAIGGGIVWAKRKRR